MWPSETLEWAATEFWTLYRETHAHWSITPVASNCTCKKALLKFLLQDLGTQFTYLIHWPQILFTSHSSRGSTKGMKACVCEHCLLQYLFLLCSFISICSFLQLTKIMDLGLRLLNHKAGLNLEFLNRRATKPIREGTQMEYYSIDTRSVFPKVQDWGSSPVLTLFEH
jgi:hypothetical protein